MVVNYTTIIDEWPYANSTSGIDNSTQIYHTQEEMHRDTHVRWAYWIVALIHVSIDDFIGILATESNTPQNCGSREKDSINKYGVTSF